MRNNIDGPQGYYAKLNKTESYTEKDLYDLYDLTYMLNLLTYMITYMNLLIWFNLHVESKTQINWTRITKQNGFIDTENTQVVAKREEG